MEMAQSSDTANTTLGDGADSRPQLEERESIDPVDPNPLERENVPPEATGDEGHNAKPSQSTRPGINTSSVKPDETLNLSLDVDDDSFLSEFAERLKLDCAIFGKVNECCQKGKGSVRKDLSFTTTMDNLRRAKESERPNKTTSSPNSSGDQTYHNHQSEVAGDVDVDKDRGESTDSSSSENDCREATTPNAQPLSTQNYNTADDDRQLTKLIKVNNRFTRQRRYKHKYFDSDGQELRFDSEGTTTTKDTYHGGIAGKFKKTTSQSKRMTTAAVPAHRLPANSVAMSKQIDSRADFEQPKIPPLSSLFDRQRRNKHTYFDSDGNEIVFDSKTNNGPEASVSTTK